VVRVGCSANGSSWLFESSVEACGLRLEFFSKGAKTYALCHGLAAELVFGVRLIGGIALARSTRVEGARELTLKRLQLNPFKILVQICVSLPHLLFPRSSNSRIPTSAA
jgi:hypothetical protein